VRPDGGGDSESAGIKGKKGDEGEESGRGEWHGLKAKLLRHNDFGLGRGA
jgi:hypothetical protein